MIVSPIGLVHLQVRLGMRFGVIRECFSLAAA